MATENTRRVGADDTDRSQNMDSQSVSDLENRMDVDVHREKTEEVAYHTMKNTTAADVHCDASRRSINTMFTQMNEFRKLNTFCDVRVIIEDKRFSCHRVVLSSVSSYFKHIFTDNFGKNDETELKLTNMSVSIFEQILNFMYTAKICINDENVDYLLSASEHLGLEYLEDLCYEYINNNIPIRKIGHIFLYALREKKSNLIVALGKYVSDNLLKSIGSKKIDDTEEFLEQDSETKKDVSKISPIVDLNEAQPESVKLITLEFNPSSQNFRSGAYDILTETKSTRFLTHLFSDSPTIYVHKSVTVEGLLYSYFESTNSTDWIVQDVTKRPSCPSLVKLKKPIFKLSNIVMTPVRRKIYFYNTEPKGTNDPMLYSYDCDRDEWFSHAASNNPKGRDYRYNTIRVGQNPCMVSLNHSVYVMGGDGCLQHCDTRTNKWYRLSDSLPHMNGAACMYHNDIFITGGLGYEKSAEIFETSACEWIEITSMPKDKFSHFMIAHGKYIYAVGGLKKTSFANHVNNDFSIIMYDVDDDEWTTPFYLPSSNGSYTVSRICGLVNY